ncbi:MAG: hypothetical protein Q9200_003460 [Gallowayella weberi]
MEKPVSGLDEPPALTILRHDEHLVFPGYDVMVGKVWKGQDEEAGCNSCTAQNYEGEGDPAAEGQNSARLSWYQKHKRKLIVAAIIWYAVFFFVICRVSFAYHLHHPHPRLTKIFSFCYNPVFCDLYLLEIVQTSSLLALAGIIAYISARRSPGSKSPAPSPVPAPAPAPAPPPAPVPIPAPAPASFEGIATFNDYSYQLETQGSTVCGGSRSLPAPLREVNYQMLADTPVPLAHMLGVAQQHATRSKTWVMSADVKEKCWEAQLCKSSMDVQRAVRGTTGEQHQKTSVAIGGSVRRELIPK